MKYLIGGFIAIFLFSVDAQCRLKVDVAVLKNGDRITGEIESLERGRLSLSTDPMGTVEIDWLDIAEVNSPQFFEIVTNNGARYFGSINSIPAEGKIVVLGIFDDYTLELNSIVYIDQIEESFWNRFGLDLEAGYSVTKANKQSQLTLGLEIEYRTPNYWSSIRFDHRSYSRTDTRKNSRNDLNLNLNRYFEKKWFAAFLSTFQQNDELSLDLRSLYGGGVGRALIYTNRVIFEAYAGLAFAREDFSTREPVNNLETVLGVQLRAFKYKTPKMNVLVYFVSYPNLTSAGRIRLEFDTRVRFELIKDLFFGLGFYSSYDNKPPSGQLTERYDYNGQTTIGWSF